MRLRGEHVGDCASRKQVAIIVQEHLQKGDELCRIRKQSPVGRGVGNLHRRIEVEDRFTFAVAPGVSLGHATGFGGRRRVIGVGHAQRLQNFFVHVSAVGLAGNDLDHPAQDEQRGVRVFKLAPGLEAQLAARNGPDNLRQILLQPEIIQRTADGPRGTARRRIRH